MNEKKLDLWISEVLGLDLTPYDKYGQWMGNTHVYWMVLQFTFNIQIGETNNEENTFNLSGYSDYPY